MAKKVMIVDDASETLALIEAILQGQGYATFASSSAEDAMLKLRHERPDLIILDIIMPEIDGFAFFKVLKKERSLATIPILVLTVRTRMEDTFRSLGVEAFLAKPLDSQKLLDCVGSIIGGQQAQEAASDTAVEARMSGGTTSSHSAGTATLPAPTPEPKVSISIKKILVVATADTVIASIKRSLAPFNANIEFVKLDLMVMSKIPSFKPDIIVLDVLFCDRPATELVFKLRQLPQMANKPIILFSYMDKAKWGTSIGQKASAVDLARTACLKAGATDSVGGFDEQVFVQMIKKYL